MRLFVDAFSPLFALFAIIFIDTLILSLSMIFAVAAAADAYFDAGYFLLIIAIISLYAFAVAFASLLS